MNSIQLRFKSSLTRIAGNPYGKEIYEEQVRDKVDWNDINEIIFPENINGVAISFVQGLMSEPMERLKTLEEYKKHFTLVSPHKNVNEKLKESINF